MTDISSSGMPSQPIDTSNPPATDGTQPAPGASNTPTTPQAGPTPGVNGVRTPMQNAVDNDVQPPAPTAAQQQAAALATKSPNPIAQHVHDIAETLAGGPQTRSVYDSTTDKVITKRVPVSTAHLGLALAMEVLRGGLAGISGDPKEAAKRGMDEGTAQVAARQKAEQDSLNQANEAQTRAFNITKTNLELHQMALNVGKQDEATNRALDATYAPVMKDLEENHPQAILTKVPEWALADAMKKYNVTKEMAIPYDTIPVNDPKTGEQAKHADGTPVWGHMYAIVDPSIKTTLSDETQTMGYNIGQFKSPDGSQVQMGTPSNWPLNDIIARHTKYAQITVAEGLLNKQIADLKGMDTDKVGPKMNLADQVRQDPTLLSAVEDYSKYAGVGDFDQIIYTMGQSNDPSEKQSAARLMQLAGVTPDDLESKHNERVQAAAEAAKPKQATPLNPEQAQLILRQVAHTDAETKKLNAETDKLLKDDANHDAIVKAVASGHVAPERLSYLLKSKDGQQLIEDVMKADPTFDSSKAAAYADVYKQFTSTKNGTAGGALNAGGTALTHLQELKELNTEASQIPYTPAWTSYQNKADTVASELAKFYGDATIPAIAAIKDTLASKAVMNRNAAIRTQAKSMGDKLDAYEQQWKNAEPSKAYEAPMPQITDKAKTARAVLDPDGYGKRSGTKPAAANPAVPGLVIH